MIEKPMTNEQKIHRMFQDALGSVKGIREARTVAEKDRSRIRELEEEAERRSLMGLGKVVNTGVFQVLKSDLLFVALTTMDFDWGCKASLVLKKGDQVVGEEVREQDRINALKKRSDVWFMHRNFVIYKDKVSFPKDIMQKVCFFEIPCLPVDWCVLDRGAVRCSAVYHGIPSTLADVFLKENYFHNLDERGLGTILIGADRMKPGEGSA